MNSERQYFIVKHDLDALKALPGFIWYTTAADRYPMGTKTIKPGDRWIAFAHVTSDTPVERLSLVTGFYECTHAVRYGEIPHENKKHPYLKEIDRAWMIQGTAYKTNLREPVIVLPLNDFLGAEKVYHQKAILRISKEVFERIYRYTLDNRLAAADVPLLGREPKCEQELLAAVIYSHKKIGIEKILSVQKAFPDLLVRLQDHAEDVYLELETYSSSFFAHGHEKAVVNRKYSKDGKSIAVLCWIDDDREKKPKASSNDEVGRPVKVRDSVHQVYEFRTLLREKKKIRW